MKDFDEKIDAFLIFRILGTTRIFIAYNLKKFVFIKLQFAQESISATLV